VLSPEDLPPVFLQEDQKFNLTENSPIGMIYDVLIPKLNNI
jgi:hypothetical protein